MADFEGISRRKRSPQLATVKKQLDKDQRITTCTDCELGIFTQHKRIWTNRGLVHDVCEEKRVIRETQTIT